MALLDEVGLERLWQHIVAKIDDSAGLSTEIIDKMGYTNIAYGTCSTAAATAAKEVVIVGNTNWGLTAGSIICVKFSVTNTAQNPTLNVNGTGAKNIYHNGTAITAGVIKAGDIATFVYDGTQYQLIAVDRTHIDYTATIATTWAGSETPYSQDITITGITANDKPIVDVTMSGTFADDQTRLAEWSKIYRITTAANKITVYATEKTTASLPIQLQVVR